MHIAQVFAMAPTDLTLFSSTSGGDIPAVLLSLLILLDVVDNGFAPFDR
jgi:hypothetical protein